jgi:uncharacterized protein (DUF488 family)
MQKNLYTIGHSTHALEHFLMLLAKNNVSAICDVRSAPYSRHNPQFNRESLKEQLRAVGIAYVFLGKELGARSENPACYIDDKVQYNYLAEEPLFVEGIKRLKAGMDRFRIALMCAERDPLTCHRTILVCREMRSPDLTIEHILADGSIETNADAEKRLMAMLDLRPDMLRDEHQCIERAYDVQAHNIAYVRPPAKPFAETRNSPDEDIHDRFHE